MVLSMMLMGSAFRFAVAENGPPCSKRHLVYVALGKKRGAKYGSTPVLAPLFNFDGRWLAGQATIPQLVA
jgi:hypothetical protein